MKPITGGHVFTIFAFAFGTIIAVNMTLAFNAVRTFPGLEVKNSYVASQGFDADRAAQNALNWEVSAVLEGAHLKLRVTQDGASVAPVIEQAIFGRATSVSADVTPEFTYRNGVFTAPVTAPSGNWNLRLVAIAGDGTRFQQRIVVKDLR